MKAKTKLLWIVTLQCVIAPASALAQSATLLTTITNPAPAYKDYFGWSVAAVGSDRVVIGAYRDDIGGLNGGVAYLLRTNGALLSTFTNPPPVTNDEFGNAVAAVGSERVVVGAWLDDRGATDAGAAYLFSTDGTLLITYTNPAPANYDYFGCSLAAVGSDRVLIGAYGKDTGAMDVGVAYLFSTNGTLVTTFTNPTPVANDWFGYSVSGVGSDRVLIGAPNDHAGATDTGAAYLFSTNGTLLTTFTNPTPADYDSMGFKVAAVGSDRVLIGAPKDDAGATDAGAAYLFSTSGILLTTFTNPAPATNDYFGHSVAGVGTDRVLIGAYLDDTGATNAGVAYWFRTDGTLLIALTNPTPNLDDYFGWAVAAVGSDRVLISAHQDDTGAIDSGTVYLFSIPTVGAPSLTIRFTTTNTVAIIWASPSTGWNLQQNTNSVSSLNWSNVTSGMQDDSTNKTLIVNPPTCNRFYRLHKP